MDVVRNIVFIVVLIFVCDGIYFFKYKKYILLLIYYFFYVYLLILYNVFMM